MKRTRIMALWIAAVMGAVILSLALGSLYFSGSTTDSNLDSASNSNPVFLIMFLFVFIVPIIPGILLGTFERVALRSYDLSEDWLRATLLMCMFGPWLGMPVLGVVDALLPFGLFVTPSDEWVVTLIGAAVWSLVIAISVGQGYVLRNIFSQIKLIQWMLVHITCGYVMAWLVTHLDPTAMPEIHLGVLFAVLVVYALLTGWIISGSIQDHRKKKGDG